MQMPEGGTEVGTQALCPSCLHCSLWILEGTEPSCRFLCEWGSDAYSPVLAHR